MSCSIPSIFALPRSISEFTVDIGLAFHGTKHLSLSCLKIYSSCDEREISQCTHTHTHTHSDRCTCMYATHTHTHTPTHTHITHSYSYKCTHIRTCTYPSPCSTRSSDKCVCVFVHVCV